MKPAKTISKALQHYNFLVTIFSFSIVGLVYVSTEYIKFAQSRSSFRVDKLNEEKAIVHSEVDKAIRTITFHRSAYLAAVCRSMRQIVRNGNRGEIPRMYGEYSTEYIRCSSDEVVCRRSLFMSSLSDLPKYFTKNIVGVDTFPKTVKDIVFSLQRYGEVYFFQRISSPSDSIPSTLVVYLFRGNSLNKLVGAVADWTKLEMVWQKQILEELSLTRFGKNGEGYIFVNTFSGDPLLTNGTVTMGNPNIWNLSDPRGNKVIQMEYAAAQKPQGDYIFYSWRKVSPPGQKVYSVDSLIYPKVSYIKGIPQLRWMVGAGVYLDELEIELSQKDAALLRTYLISLLYFFGIIVVSLAFSYLLVYRFSQQLERSTRQLIVFLQTIAHNPSEKSMVDLKFLEFQNIADIALQLETERARVESSFSQLVELNPDAIAIVQGDNFTYFNRAWQRVLGYNLDEIPTLTAFFTLAYWDEGYRLNLQERWSNFLATDLLDGQSMIDLKISCKDGVEKYFGIRVIKLLDNRLMVVLTDFTEIKEHQRQLILARRHAEEADKLKSAFLANMSHEIRTPMNAIVGFSSLLQKDTLPQDKRDKYIRLIQSSSNSLLTLINDIIDISKLESGQISITKEDTDVTKILTELYAVHKVLFEEKDNLDVRLICSFPGPLFMKVDQQRLRQILVNLIHNAYKFTDEGRVEFGFLPLEINAEVVTFFCSDTGCGIAPELGNSIFERFVTYSSSSGKINSGTGLGLAISKNLVELMGGEIWFESMVGQGTTFFFTLPLQ